MLLHKSPLLSQGGKKPKSPGGKHEKMRKVLLIEWRRAATVGFKGRRDQRVGGEVAEVRVQQNILSQALT